MSRIERIPWNFTEYRNSTTTSVSLTARPLKCLRRVRASCSFPVFRFSFLLAIVGELRPMPGTVSTAVLNGDFIAEGTSTPYAER